MVAAITSFYLKIFSSDKPTVIFPMANQMLASGGDKPPNQTIEQSISSFYLNEKLSDVCFLVGDERERIPAHRFILAAESEVFEAMFYGDLKETSDEIVVPDLSPVGFRNMLKYFYTKKANKIDLSELCPAFTAANKYLAIALISDLTAYITKSFTDISNSCIIYDQLLKLPISDLLISDVEIKIAANFASACTSHSFKQISKDTLISICQFKNLNITQVELLKACMRWTDSESARQNSAAGQASKRTIFGRIKHLIRFADLTPNEFASISGLESYLSPAEIGSYFLQIKSAENQRRPSTHRVLRNGQVTARADRAVSRDVELRFLEISIQVNRAVSIFSITTFPITNSLNLSFTVFENGQLLVPKSLVILDQETGFQSKSYTVSKILELKPNFRYKLVFYYLINRSDSVSFSYPSSLGTSKEMILRSENDEVVFKIDSPLSL